MKLGIITNAANWRSRKLQGRCTYQGLPISIENERGSYREGASPDGHFWRTFMHMAYGYIRLTEGVDGDHVDCYIGPNPFSTSVYVVHQQDPKTKVYDEDKILLGMNSAWHAKKAYLRQYDDPGFFQSMEEMTMDQFKEALKTGKGIKLKKTVEKKRLPYTRTTHAESAGNLSHLDAFTIKSKGDFPIELSGSGKSVVKPSVYKRFIDGSVANTELDSNVLEAKAALSKSNSPVDVPRKTSMSSFVCGGSSDGKIVDRVVQPVTIKMMDDFSGKKGSTQMVLHNNSMLKSLLPVNTNESVLGVSTEGSDMPSTIRSTHETKCTSSSNGSQEEHVGMKLKKSSEIVAAMKKEGKHREGDKRMKPMKASQIAMGIKVEMEHIKDKAVAKQIAMDHLQEDPDYYTHLAEMEAKYGDKMEKAKKSPEGTRSTHGGVKVVKRSGKWIPVAKDKGVEKKDPEDIRGSQSGYGTHHIEVGDHVMFRERGQTLRGLVIGQGAKGATVETPGGMITRITWDRVTGFSGVGTPTSVSEAINVSMDFVKPERFIADEWAKRMDDPNLSKDSILDKIEKEQPKVREAIESAESKLKQVEQTIHKYRVSGEGAEAVYEEGRSRKHEEIIRHLMPPEKYIAAKPSEGKRPTITMLGGRGGSGKSWFNGQVYNPDKAIVLDADEIKGMLDEYEGWNAFQVHEESSDILEKVMAVAQSCGLNVVIDATLKTPRSAMDTAQRFLASHYNLEVHYMHLPRQMAAERAISRFMGKSKRYVPVEVILGNTKNEQSFEMLRPLASAWSFRDNSGNPPPKLISEQGKGSFMAKALRDLFQTPLFKAIDDLPEPEARINADSYDFYDFRTPTDPENYSDDVKRLIAEYRKLDPKGTTKGGSKPKLEKARAGTKYIRKFWKNGQWNYVYPENGATRSPRQLPDHNVIKNLGGSTGGALLVALPNGEKKVLKHSTGPQHLKEEYMANRIYEILGVPVPHVQLRQGPKGIGQLADFIPGTPMGELDADTRRQAVESLKGGFVADALLGNWDVLGMEEDNIIWDGVKAWRIDNGGSLRYRAQGEPKHDKFGNTVGELQSMRDPYKGAGKRAYSTVTDDQVASQIDNVLAHKDAILNAIDDTSLRKVMEGRINHLATLVERKPSVASMANNDIGNKLTFTRGSSYPNDLNGVAFTPWSDAPTSTAGWAMVEGQNDSIKEPPMKVKPGLKAASGVVIEEPDGRVWIVSPTNAFGGYKNTFPKGKVDPGLSLQANAIKEAYEESGLKVEITGYLVDVDKTTSTTRYYTARRTGGIPVNMGRESEAVVLVAKTDLVGMLNQPVDHTVAYAIRKSMSDTPDGSLVKSDSGQWFLYEKGMRTKFYWFHDLEKAVSHKTYYGSDEVKARGMRWVTIRGARVLLQGTSDGGYVVVGGAGGKLNHLKIDKVLSREDYAEKRKKVDKKKNEDLRDLTKEEIAEQVGQRKAEVAAKREAREAYTEKVTSILGISKEDLLSQISAQEMDDLTLRAKAMVEGKVKGKSEEEVAAKVEATVDELAKKAVMQKTKDLERAALDTLMNDYMPGDPNVKPELKKLLDKEKAVEILKARKEFKKAMKAIGKGQADVSTVLKVGDLYAGDSDSIPEDIMEEIRQQVETQKNVQLYDRLNAQSDSIQTHIDQGSISALNGLLGDVYGSGATFSTDTIENLGLEAVVRAVTIKIQSDGKGEVVKKALEEYAKNEREKVVTRAINESDRRFANADELRNLARDTDDAEAILSMASANGHALKQLTAGQRALGTAVGSLRAVASMINALEDPPGDVVQVDIGKDLLRAKKKAHDSGLPKGTYSIKTLHEGRSKRLVLEIKKDDLDTFFTRNEQLRKDESLMAKIKRHEMNDGYKPTGIQGGITFDASQEAGIRFFKEKGAVILDFEAGLGKTGVAYAAIAEAIANKGAKKILVVTPAKTRGDFAGQSKKFLEPELQSQVHSSTETTSKSSRMERHSAESGIHIISQDALREDSEAIKAAGYDMIVVDEIHEMTAGTGQAGRFKSLMNLSDIPLKIAMSGTNIKNKKEELYRKINFIDPGHTLGSMSEFNKRYAGLNQGTGMFADAANDSFRKEISEWVYTQKNVLPVKNSVETRRVPLTPEQRKKYAASERQYREDRDAKKPGASAQRDSRNYAIITNGSSVNNGKLDEMVNIMKNVHEGEKAVIHLSRPGSPILHAVKTAVERIEKEFGVGSVGVIQGQGEGSSNSAITKLKKRFNDPNDPLRFIIGTKSLESGHNLQHGGTVTFHLDIPDSYAAFQQRNARVFRKGQDRDTHSYVLSGVNPFDMRGEDIMETKRKEQEIVGNPRDVEAMDDTGFIGLLNKYEMEAAGGLKEGE